ncbi:acetyl-CoA hydrolase/transferase C-terminal domain-containing protein [Bdellovibrio sp. NC01]|uniref:acetyl-CoA hydrolase/transferase C-terminal domain-containing protein n=1 Tax=Bdellovibrio sp. NC01 TaxID=2220073 RepID=UPI001159FC26|nr:acetyl-CoA hydrolase/transferase C-terminal domain-containing protein [Bdellovibrio sp. NC01]QDK39048.1 acetyl-CoA hydrolase [Bdellovibrio sp. NC01]
MRMFSTLKEAEDFVFAQIGKRIVMATVLGLGKPNQLINAIYNRVKKDASSQLTIFTALSLDIPDPKSDLEKRFVDVFYENHFGANYPRLEYVKDLSAHKLPKNIRVHEFYFQAGTQLHNEIAQPDYISLNYTHVAQTILEMGINVIVQLVAKSSDGKKYSLSCNPDLTLDVADLFKKHDKPLLVIGVVHPDLPYLEGDAEVDPEFFGGILESSEIQQRLFAPPKLPVGLVDHMIGFHASRLLKDDGTLQIGIGSLSDGLVHSTLLRQHNNQVYKEAVRRYEELFFKPESIDLYDEPFKVGLYGTSEMLMDGFMHLRKGGVLKRMIKDHEENASRYLHGAFFLGSAEFYKWLRELEGEDFAGLSMTRVSKVNDLYDPHELALRRQRKNARFFNTCMTMNLLGGAASETLNNGQVVSGVGGQYNFVAMSHELPDSHSVLMLKSARTKKEKRTSNIVWNNEQITIPRHLRDVVVTEYGIAALKGQSDANCIKRILAITDSEYQDELLDEAKHYGKIDKNYQLPPEVRNNTPARLKEFAKTLGAQKALPRFPFGSDFTLEEENLQEGLFYLQNSSPSRLFKTLLKGFGSSKEDWNKEMVRMKLDHPSGLQEHVFQKLLKGALTAAKKK